MNEGREILKVARELSGVGRVAAFGEWRRYIGNISSSLMRIGDGRTIPMPKSLYILDEQEMPRIRKVLKLIKDQARESPEEAEEIGEAVKLIERGLGSLRKEMVKAAGTIEKEERGGGASKSRRRLEKKLLKKFEDFEYELYNIENGR